MALYKFCIIIIIIIIIIIVIIYFRLKLSRCLHQQCSTLLL